MDDLNSNEFIFWLPMNKDFFGFKDFQKAPLNIFEIVLKNSKYEKTLSEIIKSEYGVDPEIDPQNKQRLITLPFDKYDLKIYSNGLYHFNFKKNITYSNFIEEVVELFDIEYIDEGKIFKQESENLTKNKTINLKKYDGLLTYYQIEILLSGLYDENISPSYYFNNLTKNAIIIQEITNIISLKNMFHSIILAKKDNIYKPIGSSRKNYTITVNDNIEQQFAISMEQFIRVVNTFSLEHYKRGLGFCLNELSRLGTMKSFNQNETTKDFTPPITLGTQILYCIIGVIPNNDF